MSAGSLQAVLDNLLGSSEDIDPRTSGAMRILLIDIETYPALTYQWSLWDKFTPIERIVAPGGVLCFAAKWYGEDEVLFSSLWDDGEEGMAQAAWDLLDGADAVVTYNGNKFDIPWLNHLMFTNGLGEPSRFSSIDLYATMGRFRFLSKKLDYVVQRLGIGAKVATYGFQMWVDAMPTEIGGNGDPEAQAAMKAYNIGDVPDTLEPLYNEVIGWIQHHPHVGLYVPGERCQNCGSTEFADDGYARTPLSVYPAYKCEGCGKPHRGKTRLYGVDARAV